MNRSIWTTLFSVICVIATPGLMSSASAEGGIHGHGGTILLSTPKEVHAAVDNIMKGKIQSAFYNLAFALDQIKDPHITRILNGFYDQSTPDADWENRQAILKDIATTTYWFKEDDECPADQNTRAASVPSYTPGAPICFSTPVLQQTAPEDLEAQVLALAAHEFAHHFGWHEVDAVRLQTFVFHNATALADYPERVMIVMSAIKPLLLVDRNQSSARVYFQAGKMLARAPGYDSVEPSCWLNIALGRSESNLEVIQAGKLPELYSPHRRIELMGREGGAGCDGKYCGMTSIGYIVDPVMSDDTFDPAGSSIYPMDNKTRGDFRIFNINCSGKAMKFMDLKRAFGPFLESVGLIR